MSADGVETENRHGRRYYYTIDMLDSARHLAEAFGVLDGPVNLEDSGFCERLREAWGIPEPDEDPEYVIDMVNPKALDLRYLEEDRQARTAAAPWGRGLLPQA